MARSFFIQLYKASSPSQGPDTRAADTAAKPEEHLALLAEQDL